jgi:hypothetical protein
MRAASTSFILVGCFLFVISCLPETEEYRVSSALDYKKNAMRRKRHTEEENREEFNRLVEIFPAYVSVEREITQFEKRAKCPFRALILDGIFHVICDFSQCDPQTNSRGCSQAIAYLDLSTGEYTTEEPTAQYQKVYTGCIFQGKHSIETGAPTPHE